jgi:hypothetical protein
MDPNLGYSRSLAALSKSAQSPREAASFPFSTIDVALGCPEYASADGHSGNPRDSDSVHWPRALAEARMVYVAIKTRYRHPTTRRRLSFTWHLLDGTQRKMGGNMATLGFRAVAGMVLVGALFSSTSYAQQACDRACLTKVIDGYFAALVAHDPTKLPQAAKARITENGAEKKLAQTFWESSREVVYRWDIVNTKRGDTGTEVVLRNADGSKTMMMLRLKVINGAITEIESIKCNKGEAGGLWNPDALTTVSPRLTLSLREAERDSYYDLIGATESYWRAFQTNGTPAYRRARLAADSDRIENGVHTTGLTVMRDGRPNDTARGFDDGGFIGRNLWDRRYAVVDEERGIVLTILRFGLKDGAKSQSTATAADRLVGEFFAIQNGWIREINAVLFNMPDAMPTGWPTTDYGPGKASAE